MNPNYKIFMTIVSFSFGAFISCDSHTKKKNKDTAPPPSSNIEVKPDSKISNIDEIFADMGLRRTRSLQQRGTGITIAVIDKGFTGLKEAMGQTLPGTVKHIKGVKESGDTRHGTEMLELVWLAATGTQEPLPIGQGPNLYGFEANSLSDLDLQIQRIIALGIKYVVYAQVWESTGNLDGTGIVDATVQKALDAGVVWLNSAGNSAGKSHYAPVQFSQQNRGELVLPGKGNSLWIEHGNPSQGPLPSEFEITLAWNDWQNDIEHVTTMDLDLLLLDESGRILGQSSAVQGSDETRHPREKLTANLPAGRYQIKVKLGGKTSAKQQGFDQNSRFWIVGNGDYLQFEDADSSRSVLNPANLKDVITVTASDVPYASYRADGSKPNLKTHSIIKYSTGEAIGGSSTAVALAMGALASHMGEKGFLDRDQIFDLLINGDITGTQHVEGLDHLDKFPALFFGQEKT